MEWIVGIIVLIFIASLFKPRSCDICGTGFKRKYHTWTIGGKKQHLCPYCNGKMNRKNADQRFKDRFG